MNKFTIFVVLLGAFVAISEGAVIIKKAGSEPSSSVAASRGGVRIITVHQSGDRVPRKRDSPPATLLAEEVVPAQRRNTFSVNQKRPCTFCKFFTTVTPAPKQKMYFKFVKT
uniref:(northern house mosquito) hypothetical protein n=1 Tax=Culex pipiens TaxID=7175 RepID=A0A8D8FQZ7_CULPI